MYRVCGKEEMVFWVSLGNCRLVGFKKGGEETVVCAVVLVVLWISGVVIGRLFLLQFCFRLYIL